MQYIKGNQLYTIEDQQPERLQLIDDCNGSDGMNEGMHCAHVVDHYILMNHPLAFCPYPAWGLIIPDERVTTKSGCATVKLSAIRPKNPETGMIVLHPEAWNSLHDKEWIDDEGYLQFNKYQADQAKLQEEAEAERLARGTVAAGIGLTKQAG